jgi:DNA-binding Lrp family transcriptional regulator
LASFSLNINNFKTKVNFRMKTITTEQKKHEPSRRNNKEERLFLYFPKDKENRELRTDSVLLVLAYIARAAASREFVGFRAKYVAPKLGLSVDAVRKALRALVRNNVIKIIKRTKSKGFIITLTADLSNTRFVILEDHELALLRAQVLTLKEILIVKAILNGVPAPYKFTSTITTPEGDKFQAIMATNSYFFKLWGISRSTVWRSLKKFEKLGILSVVIKPRHKNGKKTTYRGIIIDKKEAKEKLLKIAKTLKENEVQKNINKTRECKRFVPENNFATTNRNSNSFFNKNIDIDNKLNTDKKFSSPQNDEGKGEENNVSNVFLDEFDVENFIPGRKERIRDFSLFSRKTRVIPNSFSVKQKLEEIRESIGNGENSYSSPLDSSNLESLQMQGVEGDGSVSAGEQDVTSLEEDLLDIDVICEDGTNLESRQYNLDEELYRVLAGKGSFNVKAIYEVIRRALPIGGKFKFRSGYFKLVTDKKDIDLLRNQLLDGFDEDFLKEYEVYRLNNHGWSSKQIFSSFQKSGQLDVAVIVKKKKRGRVIVAVGLRFNYEKGVAAFFDCSPEVDAHNYWFIWRTEEEQRYYWAPRQKIYRIWYYDVTAPIEVLKGVRIKDYLELGGYLRGMIFGEMGMDYGATILLVPVVTRKSYDRFKMSLISHRRVFEMFSNMVRGISRRLFGQRATTRAGYRILARSILRHQVSFEFIRRHLYTFLRMEALIGRLWGFVDGFNALTKILGKAGTWRHGTLAEHLDDAIYNLRKGLGLFNHDRFGKDFGSDVFEKGDLDYYQRLGAMALNNLLQMGPKLVKRKDWHRIRVFIYMLMNEPSNYVDLQARATHVADKLPDYFKEISERLKAKRGVGPDVSFGVYYYTLVELYDIFTKLISLSVRATASNILASVKIVLAMQQEIKRQIEIIRNELEKAIEYLTLKYIDENGPIVKRFMIECKTIAAINSALLYAFERQNNHFYSDIPELTDLLIHYAKTQYVRTQIV